LYIGWLSTDQLFLELPNFLEKYVPTMPKIWVKLSSTIASVSSIMPNYILIIIITKDTW
jgi:hypothetical protein